jgi:hypothetical protein
VWGIGLGGIILHPPGRVDRIGRKVDGNLFQDGGIEEGERGGEYEDHFSSVLEGSVHFAHSDGADPLRSRGSKRGFSLS